MDRRTGMRGPRLRSSLVLVVTVKGAIGLATGCQGEETTPVDTPDAWGAGDSGTEAGPASSGSGGVSGYVPVCTGTGGTEGTATPSGLRDGAYVCVAMGPTSECTLGYLQVFENATLSVSGNTVILSSWGFGSGYRSMSGQWSSDGDTFTSDCQHLYCGSDARIFLTGGPSDTLTLSFHSSGSGTATCTRYTPPPRDGMYHCSSNTGSPIYLYGISLPFPETIEVAGNDITLHSTDIDQGQAICTGTWIGMTLDCTVEWPHAGMTYNVPLILRANPDGTITFVSNATTATCSR